MTAASGVESPAAWLRHGDATAAPKSRRLIDLSCKRVIAAARLSSLTVAGCWSDPLSIRREGVVGAQVFVGARKRLGASLATA